MNIHNLHIVVLLPVNKILHRLSKKYNEAEKSSKHPDIVAKISKFHFYHKKMIRPIISFYVFSLIRMVPEFIDLVFAKTSPKCSFSLTEIERFGLVFAKNGSINSGTGVYVFYYCNFSCRNFMKE